MAYPWHLENRSDDVVFMLDTLNSTRTFRDLYTAKFEDFMQWAWSGVASAKTNAERERPGKWPHSVASVRHTINEIREVFKRSTMDGNARSLQWLMEHVQDEWPDGAVNLLGELQGKKWLPFWLTIPDTPEARTAISVFFSRDRYGQTFLEHMRNYTIGDYFQQSREFWRELSPDPGSDPDFFLDMFEEAREIGVLSCHPDFEERFAHEGINFEDLLAFFIPDYEARLRVMFPDGRCLDTAQNPPRCRDGSGSCDGNTGSSTVCQG